MASVAVEENVHQKYWKVKDIMTVPCARRIDGTPAITVSHGPYGSWAMVNYADGIVRYRFDKRDGFWHVHSCETFTNF